MNRITQKKLFSYVPKIKFGHCKRKLFESVGSPNENRPQRYHQTIPEPNQRAAERDRRKRLEPERLGGLRKVHARQGLRGAWGVALRVLHRWRRHPWLFWSRGNQFVTGLRLINFIYSRIVRIGIRTVRPPQGGDSGVCPQSGTWQHSKNLFLDTQVWQKDTFISFCHSFFFYSFILFAWEKIKFFS